jgi:thiamine pyrophosphate-dependent acetolactate synthase large subunit-like protein
MGYRFYRYRQHATELAPTSGAMGYGLPVAVAAKLKHPERQVVCFAGDGCFMMYPQELATAAQYGAAAIVIAVNNGMLGTIRMHQEREYPGRISSTNWQNPRFAALAHAFGAFGEVVERTEDFPEAFARAQARRHSRYARVAYGSTADQAGVAAGMIATAGGAATRRWCEPPFACCALHAWPVTAALFSA